MLCGYGVRVLLWDPFFSFYHSYLDLSVMIFMLNYAFNHILFSLRILLLAVEMSDKQAFRSQARQIAATGPMLRMLF